MKRVLGLSGVLLILLLAACDLPGPTTTPTDEPGVTDTPTTTAGPVTIEPSSTPTVVETPVPTGTREPVESLNLIEQPGFEGPYRKVFYGEVNVDENWNPFYIEGVPSDKPDQPLLGRPEYKPIDAVNFPAQVHSGDLAQTWFSMFRPSRAGIYKTFEVWPGFDYVFKIWVRSWSNFTIRDENGNIIDDDPESELDTEDQRNASQWAIKIDPLGGEDPDAVAMIICRLGGIAHYDNWVEFECAFTAETNRATVFVENTRPWGLQNQDSYVDDAFLGCYDCPDAPFQTPTPRATEGPSPTPVPRTLDPAIKLFPFAVYESDTNMVIRSDHSTNSTALGTLPANTQRFAYARWQATDGITTWACIDEAWDVVDHPDYAWLSILQCDQWVAVYLNGVQYGTISEAVPIDGDGLEAQGLELNLSNISFLEDSQMEWNTLLDLLFLVIAGVFAFPSGSLLGMLVSGAVDVVKGLFHVFGIELNEEWGGRAFALVNFAVFAGVFLITGVNPADYILPADTAAIVELVVNALLAVSGLLGAFKYGGLLHKELKAVAPVWFSIKERKAILGKA